MAQRRKASDNLPSLTLDPKAESWRKLKSEQPFVHERRKTLRNLAVPSERSRSRKELYREVVADFASDPLVDGIG